MVYIPMHKKYLRSAKRMVGGSILNKVRRNTSDIKEGDCASINGDGYLRKSNVIGGIYNNAKVDHTAMRPQLKKHVVLSAPHQQLPPIVKGKPQSKEMAGAGLLSSLVKMPSIKNAKKQRNSLKIAL